MTTTGNTGEKEAQRPRALRVLVIDDEEFIRSVLTEILQAEGYEVVGASGGEAAIERLRGEQFDLVITDLVMPGVGGMEVLRVAKRVDPGLPVVVMTGYPSSATVAEPRSQRMDITSSSRGVNASSGIGLPRATGYPVAILVTAAAVNRKTRRWES